MDVELLYKLDCYTNVRIYCYTEHGLGSNKFFQSVSACLVLS